MLDNLVMIRMAAILWGSVITGMFSRFLNPFSFTNSMVFNRDLAMKNCVGRLGNLMPNSFRAVSATVIASMSLPCAI